MFVKKQRNLSKPSSWWEENMWFCIMKYTHYSRKQQISMSCSNYSLIVFPQQDVILTWWTFWLINILIDKVRLCIHALPDTSIFHLSISFPWTYSQGIFHLCSHGPARIKGKSREGITKAQGKGDWNVPQTKEAGGKSRDPEREREREAVEKTTDREKGGKIFSRIIFPQFHLISSQPFIISQSQKIRNSEDCT